MSRIILGFVALLAVAATLAGPVAPRAEAEIASFEDATKEAVLGKADAPVTLIEYASLGCPHCANFHADVYPHIKRDFIDTGKVRMIFRDFPLGTPALAAAMISRCAGSRRYMGMVEIFFRSLRQWAGADNPLQALKKIARFGGMSESDVDACLANQELLDHIQEKANDAQVEHDINSTPSFVIGGRTISGGLAYEDFKEILDEAVAKAK